MSTAASEAVAAPAPAPVQADYGPEEAAMQAYLAEGERRAFALGNRGPIRFLSDGSLAPDILDAYWRCGFYVFEGVIGAEELADVEADLFDIIDRLPTEQGSPVDAKGRPASPTAARPRPSSGRSPSPIPSAAPTSRTAGTRSRCSNRSPPRTPRRRWSTSSSGRSSSPKRASGSTAPRATPGRGRGQRRGLRPVRRRPLHQGAGAGRLRRLAPGRGHPLESPDWDQGSHGFNFMAQLYGCTPANGVWVVPGTHRLGKVDIKAKVAEAGTERLPDAVPMVCAPGDVVISNRQVLHGSFANTSDEWRVTVNMGFHRRASVLGVQGGGVHNAPAIYDEERIRQRSA